MKRILVIDDLREFSFPAIYERTSVGGIDALSSLALPLDELWLDHDLGGDDNIRPVVDFLEERAFLGNPVAIGKIVICTSNPVGRAYIEAGLSKYYYIGHWLPS